MDQKIEKNAKIAKTSNQNDLFDLEDNNSKYFKPEKYLGIFFFFDEVWSVAKN